MTELHHIGIDVGGTFTDVVCSTQDDIVQLKVPTVSDDPARGVLRGIRELAELLFTTEAELLASARIVHGTTIGLNTVLTRSGAKTALLTTAGFRDIIDMRLGYKESRYDFDATQPRSLVPRSLRRGIRERIDSDGKIVVPLDESNLREEARALRALGVEAVAIGFLWSFMNPAHEVRALAIVQDEMPGVYVTSSWDVMPELREYDRLSTTIANAYIGPRIRAYVGELESSLRSKGFTGSVRYLQSHGGVTDRLEVERVPVRTLMSGPAAGASSATYFAQRAGTDNAICMDMGGTSLDVSVVTRGEVRLSKPSVVGDVRIGLPTVDIHSVAGGGGSIAHCDHGLLRVGPESAGARPGPAAYGLGGVEPTVTDSAVVLGTYAPGPISGGLALDGELADRAVASLGSDLGLSTFGTATGIQRVLAIDFAQTIREITIAEGRDPRTYSLICGGGGGPAHYGPIVEELEINEVIVPRLAGALCALGAILSDTVYEERRSLPMRLTGNTVDLPSIEAGFGELEDSIRARVGAARGDASSNEDGLRISRYAEIRYREQLWELSIEVPSEVLDARLLADVLAAFHEKHRQTYSYSEPQTPCELVSLSVRATADTSVVLPTTTSNSTSWGPASTRDVFDPVSGGFTTVPVHSGADAPVDEPLRGPALIVESGYTLVVDPGWTARLRAWGAYVLTRD